MIFHRPGPSSRQVYFYRAGKKTKRLEVIFFRWRLLRCRNRTPACGALLRYRLSEIIAAQFRPARLLFLLATGKHNQLIWRFTGPSALGSVCVPWRALCVRTLSQSFLPISSKISKVSLAAPSFTQEFLG